ncbi:mas-related G-protein coupled receptor member H-like [Lissotriton helveticus]
MAYFTNSSIASTFKPEGNSTELANHDAFQKRLYFAQTLEIVTLVICFIGLVGNGIILWFLFFKMKKNNCNIYIINLAIADAIFLFGCTIILVVFICVINKVEASVTDSNNALKIAEVLYSLGFNASSFVLTAISVERCLCVLLPVWYHHRQLTKQSVIVCLLLWALSCLVVVLESVLCKLDVPYPEPGSESCTGVYLFTSALYLLVVLLMVLSSLTLIIEIRKTSNECRPLRLYIVIMVTVVIFLLSVVPTRVLGLLLYFGVLPSEVFLVEFANVIFFCTSIYCSTNPYVFICVGMWNKHCFWRSIKQALEKIFKETETSWQKQSVDS